MSAFVRLEPALVHKIWGGKRLGEPNEVGEGVGEAWILSAREDNPSIVASGPHAGESFLDYVNELGPAGLGKNAEVMDAFPTLTPTTPTRAPTACPTARPRCGSSWPPTQAPSSTWASASR